MDYRFRHCRVRSGTSFRHCRVRFGWVLHLGTRVRFGYVLHLCTVGPRGGSEWIISVGDVNNSFTALGSLGSSSS